MRVEVLSRLLPKRRAGERMLREAYLSRGKEVEKLYREGMPRKGRVGFIVPELMSAPSRTVPQSKKERGGGRLPKPGLSLPRIPKIRVKLPFKKKAEKDEWPELGTLEI